MLSVINFIFVTSFILEKVVKRETQVFENFFTEILQVQRNWASAIKRSNQKESWHEQWNIAQLMTITFVHKGAVWGINAFWRFHIKLQIRLWELISVEFVDLLLWAYLLRVLHKLLAEDKTVPSVMSDYGILVINN